MVCRKPARILGLPTRNEVRHPFQVSLAEDLARVFHEAGVEYLFLGKGGAILLGYPGTTQDVDVFARKDPENGRRIAEALRKLGFEVEERLVQELIAGRDFVQIKNGPFDVDVIFAPDGITSFEVARQRSITEGIFPIANLQDIIASKRASGRQKDQNELPLLESFREEYEKRHGRALRSASEIAAERRGPRNK